MNTILEQYKDKINGIFSFFDRIIIKGLQFTVQCHLVNFL